MPWEESSAMDQRVRFVARFREGDVTMTALCESFGISRECGYKWLRRYEEEGVDGLKEKSRAPHEQANAVAPKIVDAVLDLRRKHPTWGARKLLAWLERRQPRTAWPSASAVANWIKSHGLAAPRRRRFHAVPAATSELANSAAQTTAGRPISRVNSALATDCIATRSPSKM